VVAGGEVGPGPVGGFAEHAGQDQDLDRWHLLGDLTAAVVEFVAVFAAGVGVAAMTVSRSTSWRTWSVVNHSLFMMTPSVELL
jgi:hypothetical protein